jgi:hypothetical protein
LPASYSDVRQLDFNSPFDITATTDGSCETTNLELQPVVVSEIPNDKEELEAYLRLTGLQAFLFFVFCFLFCFCFLRVSVVCSSSIYAFWLPL